MYSEKYIRVTERIAESEDWTLYTLLKDLKPVEQIKKIKQIFLVICKKRDDKPALQCFKWLLNAVDDAKLVPFLEKEREKEILSSAKEVESARLKARTDRAKIARQLYNKLPDCAKGTARQFIAQDESIPVDIDIPIFLKTKYAMLIEVAEWWRDTKDEKEADEIFNFLNDVPTQFEEDTKIKLGVIRKATGSGFPVSRLTRQLLLLVEGCENSYYREDDIAPILAIARARNRAANVTGLEMTVLQHLEKCTKDAFQFLESIAKKISTFDAEVRELIEMIKSDYDISGKIQISYPNASTVKILIEQKSRSINESDIHRQFEKARDHILKWKKKHSNREVELTLNVKDEYYTDPSKLLFNRKQIF